MTNEPEGYWRLVDPVWDKIDIYSGSDKFLREYEAADRSKALLFAAHFAQSEICNGGFKQLFSNSTGVLVPEAIEGFLTIGMPETAEIVASAVSLFGNVYPRERMERQTMLEKLDKHILDEMNERFFVLIEAENGGFESAADRFAMSILG